MSGQTGGISGEQGIIRIDKEGTWYYNELPIVNRTIYLFFNKHICKDDDGGYSLRIEGQTCRLLVEDTPYVVSGITFVSGEEAAKGYFRLRLNDDTEEPLALETLFIGQDNIPYCQVKQGVFPARFLRAPYYRLAEHIRQDRKGGFYFNLNGSRRYIPYRS